MRTLVLAIVCLPIVIAPSFTWASEPFLKVNYFVHADLLARPNGARGLAMGMTGVADAADPTNVFYNPGVIALVDGIAVTQSYTDWADSPNLRTKAWEVAVTVSSPPWVLAPQTSVRISKAMRVPSV